MRLTDLMSGADLDLFASVSMAIFLVVFASVLVRVLMMPRSRARQAASMPLEDQTPITRGSEEQDHG